MLRPLVRGLRGHLLGRIPRGRRGNVSGRGVRGCVLLVGAWECVGSRWGIDARMKFIAIVDVSG